MVPIIFCAAVKSSVYAFSRNKISQYQNSLKSVHQETRKMDRQLDRHTGRQKFFQIFNITLEALILVQI